MALLTEALADPRTPPIWRTRHRVLLTHLGGDDPTAGRQARWLASSIRRAHEARRCARADHALELPELPVEVRLDLLDNRVFSLQNLDRLDEADRHTARGGTAGRPPPDRQPAGRHGGGAAFLDRALGRRGGAEQRGDG